MGRHAFVSVIAGIGYVRTCIRVCLKPPLFAPLKIIEMWRSHIKACHQCLASDLQMKQPACGPAVQMASEWCQIHYNGIWSAFKPLCCCSHWQRRCLWLTMTLFLAAHLLDLYKLRVWLRVLKEKQSNLFHLSYLESSALIDLR